MAFLGFGLFKRMPPGTVELEIEVARATIEGDTETIMQLGAETGFFPEPEKFNPDKGAPTLPRRDAWYTEDAYIEVTPEWATQVLIDMSDPRSEYFSQMRHENAPPDHIFGRRGCLTAPGSGLPRRRPGMMMPNRVSCRCWFPTSRSPAMR
jgi:hypothetical protein